MRTGWSSVLFVWLAAGLAACGGDDAGSSGNEPPLVQPGPAPAMPVVPASSVDSGPWVLDTLRGQALFTEKCQHCHGLNATGGYGPALTSTVTCPPCAGFTMLWQRIDEFMPLRNPEACDADCSRSIAAWISNGFSTLPSCSVDFRYDSVAGQRFSATILIRNFRGANVPTWRLGFTLPANHDLTGTMNALATVAGNQVELRPLPAGPDIANGATVEIGLQGTHGGLTAMPTDLRLEASPCFTGA
jgi:hypothetical protein